MTAQMTSVSCGLLWFSTGGNMSLPKPNVGVPGGSDGKEPACNAGDLGSIPRLRRSPGEWNGNPLEYACLENPTDRSLAGFSLWGHKESDMTE